MTAAFDMKSYRELALRTEAPITETTRHRVVRTYEILHDEFESTISSGKILDRLKRYTYYGKEDEELIEQVMPTHPTGEKKERILQCIGMLHAMVGIIGEAGELCEELFNYIEDGTPPDKPNMEVECGDLLWYINLMLYYLGGKDIVDIAEANLRKLAARYPDKFNLEHALNRDNHKEMLAFLKS